MTTTVNVQAAGHNLVIIQQDAFFEGGEVTHYVDSYAFVKKGAAGTFYAHSTRDITVSEVDSNSDLNALIEADDYAGALAWIEAVADDEVLFGTAET